MSYGYLAVGIIVGVVVFAGVLTITGQPPVDGDAVCAERFGDNWTSQNMDQQLPVGNNSVNIACTNGTATEEISVAVEVDP